VTATVHHLVGDADMASEREGVQSDTEIHLDLAVVILKGILTEASSELACGHDYWLCDDWRRVLNGLG
jgi:hypothetical protein